MSSSSAASVSAQKEGFPEYEGYPGYDVHDPRERIDQSINQSQKRQIAEPGVASAPPGGPVISSIDNNMINVLTQNINNMFSKVNSRLDSIDKKLNLMDQSLAVMNVTVERFGSQAQSSSPSSDKRINIANLVCIKKSVIDYATVNGYCLTIYKKDGKTMSIDFSYSMAAENALEALNDELND